MDNQNNFPDNLQDDQSRPENGAMPEGTASPPDGGVVFPEIPVGQENQSVQAEPAPAIELPRPAGAQDSPPPQGGYAPPPYAAQQGRSNPAPYPQGAPYPPNAPGAGYYAQYGAQGYQGYQVPPPRPAPRHESRAIGFNDLSGLARWLLITGILLIISSVIYALTIPSYMHNIVMGGTFAPEGLVYYLGSSLTSLSSTAFSVLTLIFVYKANQNLPLIGCPIKKYSPGWALAWFIIPIASIVMCLPVMLEIWRGSQPGYHNWRQNGEPLPPQPLGAPVIFWFSMQFAGTLWSIVYVVRAFAGMIAGISTLDTDRIIQASISGAGITLVVAGLGSVIFAIVALIIARRQKEKYETAQAFYRANSGRGW